MKRGKKSIKTFSPPFPHHIYTLQRRIFISLCVYYYSFLHSRIYILHSNTECSTVNVFKDAFVHKSIPVFKLNFKIYNLLFVLFILYRSIERRRKWMERWGREGRVSEQKAETYFLETFFFPPSTSSLSSRRKISALELEGEHWKLGNFEWKYRI